MLPKLPLLLLRRRLYYGNPNLCSRPHCHVPLISDQRRQPGPTARSRNWLLGTLAFTHPFLVSSPAKLAKSACPFAFAHDSPTTGPVLIWPSVPSPLSSSSSPSLALCPCLTLVLPLPLPLLPSSLPRCSLLPSFSINLSSELQCPCPCPETPPACLPTSLPGLHESMDFAARPRWQPCTFRTRDRGTLFSSFDLDDDD
ncbi:hypothetical protein Mapa_008820 [Marchantia paleacea]|nr:hypothetical protein Mapa_008820 [Marchantia paleacea]